VDTCDQASGAGPGYGGVMRVVSLLPSATEIVYALGRQDELVGVTFECDEPASARVDKAVVIGGRDTSAMSPAAIDAYVQDQVAAGRDLYTLHADALGALAPDVILTQDLCRVCALPAGHVTDALDYLGCTADVVSLDPHSLDDVLETIMTVGRHTGAERQAGQLVASLRRRLAAVTERVAGLPRPTVAVVEWVDPPFSAGHWVPDLVVAAGGQPVAAQAGGRSTVTSWEQIAASRPDLVVVAPCGFHLNAAAAQADLAVRELPGLPVWAIDADGLVVRPGPRLVDGVEALAAIVHPDAAAAVPPGRIQRIA
jgi:iron complex transport system substrate-binding protein